MSQSIRLGEIQIYNCIPFFRFYPYVHFTASGRSPRSFIHTSYMDTFIVHDTMISERQVLNKAYSCLTMQKFARSSILTPSFFSVKLHYIIMDFQSSEVHLILTIISPSPLFSNQRMNFYPKDRHNDHWGPKYSVISLFPLRKFCFNHLNEDLRKQILRRISLQRRFYF